MRLGLLAFITAALLGCAGCGGSDAPNAQPSSKAASCTGGQIRILQGQPTDLPGGGSAGIGQVRRSDPPTVRLVLGGAATGETAAQLAVGDRFTVQGAGYEITCISASTVTAKPAS